MTKLKASDDYSMYRSIGDGMMKLQEGATDSRSGTRRKPGKQKNVRDRKEHREQVNPKGSSRSMHDRRELLRVEELEEEIFDPDTGQ